MPGVPHSQPQNCVRATIGNDQNHIKIMMSVEIFQFEASKAFFRMAQLFWVKELHGIKLFPRW